jgi:hypothetical protein
MLFIKHNFAFCKQQQKSYGAGDKEVCEFNSVEDFWKYWSFIPKPRFDNRLCFISLKNKLDILLSIFNDVMSGG